MRLANAFASPLASAVAPARGMTAAMNAAMAGAMFRLPMLMETRPTQALAAAAPVLPRRGEKARAAIAGGRRMLGALDQLKAALLGDDPAAALATLSARLAEDAPSSGDPALDDLIEQIRLRADVELAKARQRSGQDQLAPRNQQHDAQRAQNAEV